MPGDEVMTSMARVVVIGDLMTDAVARATLPLARGSDTPANVTMHGGGSGANIAAWMAADGGDVAFVGRRGADIAGRNRDMELMGYGVDARLVMDPERPTGTCVVMVTHKGEHTMLSDPGANAALSPDDLPHDLFVPGAHLHVSGYTLLSEGSRAAALAALDFSRRVGMSASVDGASAAPLERVGAEPFLELSGNAVLLFVNVPQATVLTGREDPEAAARVLTAWYPQVVIKLGAEGALFFANGRPPVRVPAPPVERVIDGTGAGDAFTAGFLPAWLDKKPPMEALASGSRLAAHALNLIGARPIQLSPGGTTRVLGARWQRTPSYRAPSTRISPGGDDPPYPPRSSRRGAAARYMQRFSGWWHKTGVTDHERSDRLLLAGLPEQPELIGLLYERHAPSVFRFLSRRAGPA